MNLKIIEKVSNFDKIGEAHYLPHKSVIKDEKNATKIRVLFDVSCPSRKGGLSLTSV